MLCENYTFPVELRRSFYAANYFNAGLFVFSCGLWCLAFLQKHSRMACICTGTLFMLLSFMCMYFVCKKNKYLRMKYSYGKLCAHEQCKNQVINISYRKGIYLSVISLRFYFFRGSISYKYVLISVNPILQDYILPERPLETIKALFDNGVLIIPYHEFENHKEYFSVKSLKEYPVVSYIPPTIERA